MEKRRYKLFAADKVAFRRMMPLSGANSVVMIDGWWRFLISVFCDQVSFFVTKCHFFLVAKSIFTCSKFILWLLCIFSERKSLFFFLLQVIINVKFKKNERVRALHFWRLKNACNLLVWNTGRTYWWQSFDLFLLKIASRVQRDVQLTATEKSQEHFLPYVWRVCSHL